MKSEINPFDSQEAKPYKNDPEILAMTNLVSAYQNDDISEFESILKKHRANIMDDPFIKEHIEGKVKIVSFETYNINKKKTVKNISLQVIIIIYMKNSVILRVIKLKSFSRCLNFSSIISDLLRNIRTQVLMKLIKPYTRIHIPFISKELNIDANEVENLLVSCILDNMVKGRIDQVNQVLELNREKSCSSRYNSIDKWTTQLSSLYNTITSKVI